MFLRKYAKMRGTTIYELFDIMKVPKSSAYNMADLPEKIPAYALVNLSIHFRDPQIFTKFKSHIPRSLRYVKKN